MFGGAGVFGFYALGALTAAAVLAFATAVAAWLAALIVTVVLAAIAGVLALGGKEIEATRRELGDTVEALAAKTDVKARAEEKIGSVRESVARPAVLVPAAAVALAVLAWRLTRR